MRLSSSSSSSRLSNRPPAAAGPCQHSTRACRAVNTVTAAASEGADAVPQQQPRIVLSPLPAPPGLLSGTASVGSWSTGGRSSSGYQHQQQPRQHHRNPKQQQQRRHQHQHQQHRPGGSAQGAEMARLTRTISGATSVQQLIDIFHTRRHTESYNLIHTSTAYRVLVSLLKQQHQQQVAPASADHVVQLLQLLEQRTVDKLAGAVAATTQRIADADADATAAAAGNGTSSSSSQWQQAPAAVPGWDERAISTIVHSCAHLQHRPEWEYLELLLEAFLLLQAPALQQQRQQQQEQQQQQQQHKQPRKSSPAQDSCHALSLLCWGLAKLGFASESAYQPRSYSSQQQQQELDEEEWSGQQEQQQQLAQQHERLVLQQQYWARLAAAALQVVPGVASARDLSTLAYGFAAAGCKDVVLWSRLGPHSVAVLESCTPYDMSQLLWAYGTAGVPYQPLIQGAVKAAAQLLPYFAPQGLANVLWAVTSLNGHVPAELMAAASRECLARDLASFGSVNLNMLVWACARCRHMSPELAVAVNRAVLQLLPTFSVHNLSRVLGALAGLQCLQPAVLAAAEAGLMQRLETGRIHVQVGCQVVWAYATVDAEAALRLLPPLLALATQHVQQLARSSDATGKLCSTLVMLRYRADEFVDALAACLLGETRSAGARQRGSSGAHAAQQQDGPMHHWHQQLSIRHILAIAMALARLGYTQHKPLLQALTEQYLTRVPSSITSASARDSHSSRGRSSSGGDADAAAPAVAASYDEQRMLQHALVLLWCAAVLDVQQPVQLLARLVKLLHHLQLEQLTTVSLAQAAQVYMWCQTLGPAGAPLVAKLPQPLVTSALQVWQQQLVPAVTRSDMQAAVLSHLRGMQLQPVLEGLTPDGMFSVDVMLRYAGVDVALEVMGPEHYSVNEVLLRPAAAAAAAAGTDYNQQASTAPSGRSSRSHAQRGGNATDAAAADEAGQQQQQPPRPRHVLSGPDLLRLRLLAARGFALAAVSSYELGALLSRRPAAVRQLLRGKLDEAVAHHLALPGSLRQPSASAGKADGKQQQEQLMSRFALQADMRPAQERKWHRQDRRRQPGSGGDMQQAALQAVLSAALPGASSSVVQQASAVDSTPAAARAAPRLVIEREFDLSLDLDELMPSEDGKDGGLTAGGGSGPSDAG